MITMITPTFQLDEKNRKIRSLEEKCQSLEEGGGLEGELNNLKSIINEKDVKNRDEVSTHALEVHRDLIW